MQWNTSSIKFYKRRTIYLSLTPSTIISAFSSNSFHYATILLYFSFREISYFWRTNRSRGPHTNCRELKGKKLYGSESFIFIGIWEKRLPIFQNFQSQMNNACMSLSMHASWRFGGVHHSHLYSITALPFTFSPRKLCVC